MLFSIELGKEQAEQGAWNQSYDMQGASLHELVGPKSPTQSSLADTQNHSPVVSGKLLIHASFIKYGLLVL